MKKVQSVAFGVMLAASCSSAALAQVAPTQAGTPQSGDAGASQPAAVTSGVGDIVVTANRRSENLQKVPISIDAFDGKTLTQLGIQSTNDLPQLTPGLSQSRSVVGVNAYLRGVGTNTGGYSSELPVATYLDGLYLPNAAAAAFSFNNIERIEVLKGPQGTLYGRNTTGGLIHVVTRDPGIRPSLDASVSYGNYATTQLNFYGSTSLTDSLAANVAAVYIDQADGWGRNAYTGSAIDKLKDFGIQAKLKWNPAANTTVILQGFYDHVNSDEGLTGQIYPGTIGADGTGYLGHYVTNTRVNPWSTQEQKIISLKVEQNLGFAKLTSTTGYIDNYNPGFFVQTYNVGNPVAGQAAANVGLDQRSKTFSQEMQLVSNAQSPLSWILGTFYYHDNTDDGNYVYGTCVASVCAGSIPTATLGLKHTRSISAYGDTTYAFSSATRLTLGLRYTRDEKSLSGTVSPLPGFPNSVVALPSTTVINPGQPFAGFPDGIATQAVFSKLTYRAIFAQDFGDNVHAFASYNRGFRAGDFNPFSFTNPPVLPEVLDAFEVGFKSRTTDRTLQFNASAFYYFYDNMQVRTTAPPALPGTTLVYNAANAHIKGIDADVVLVPFRGFSLTGGLELLDAKYVNFPGICSAPAIIGGNVLGGYTTFACNLSGRYLPQAPTFSSTLGVDYKFETHIGEFELNGSDGYKSRSYWEPNNRISQAGYHIVNAALTWKPQGSDVSVQGFAHNLTGSYYFTGGTDGTGGNNFGIPGAPRTYGIKVSYKY